MKLTIGMASYNNYQEVWFTIQALRLYQDLADTEILIVDNYGCEHLQNFVNAWASSCVRYVKFDSSKGTAAPRNRVFAEAAGEWVICMDSHILLVPGAVARFKEWAADHNQCLDLLQGPLLYDNLLSSADSFSTTWSDGMWGQWNNLHTDRGMEPYEIPMMGMGLFACRKDAWLGFNPAFRGFGGEEGYIHEKYRQAGRKTLCLPWMEWVHQFRAGATPYPLNQEDKLRNYLIGFEELGLDIAPLIEHFGANAVDRHRSKPAEQKYLAAVSTPSDINEHLQYISGMAGGKRITEFGVRLGVSTTAWLWGRPACLNSWDINSCPVLGELHDIAAELGVNFSFQVGSSTTTPITETDILFIDTLHTAGQLTLELEALSGQVRERIVLHDTLIYGAIGEDGGPGLNSAITAFLGIHPEWVVETVFTHNNGLTVLRRV